ncbi:putative ubiquinone biosynthesis monooxygenase [Parahypoxylon ruwenzoriense]
MDFSFFNGNSKGISELERMSQLGRKDSSRSLGNRSLSIRSNKGGAASGSPSVSASSSAPRRNKGFSFASLRGSIQPEISRRLYQVIKSTNNLVSAHEAAGREREAVARQLSEWGEQTHDAAVSDISDKVGVVLCELGAQEEAYAHALDEARAVLKTIRNTERSVQPSRDAKAKIADDIQKLKFKEPQSPRLVILEQELVRAEAENLVAEAQLTNITRNKLKSAYDAEFAAVIERAEKQIILARHGRRLLDLLDDSPVTPGDPRRGYRDGAAARQVLNDAEDDLKSWERRAAGLDSVGEDDGAERGDSAVGDGDGDGGNRGGGGAGETAVMTGAIRSASADHWDQAEQQETRYATPISTPNGRV